MFGDNILRDAASLAAAAFAHVVLWPATAFAESPFAALAGTWSGSGVAQFDGGVNESLRCKGYYTNSAGPQFLALSIRCANASAKIELRANLTDKNGTIEGDWEERTYNQSGTVAGNSTPDKLDLTISGGIAASMVVTVSGKTQSVNVVTGGPTLKGVNVTMSR